jgi:hypothetical protein
MNAVLINTLLSLILMAFKLLYEQMRMMDPNTVFQQYFDWFAIKYRCTLAEDCKTNRMAMATNWHPSMGFEALTLRLFHGIAFQASQATLSQTRTWSTLASTFSTARDSSPTSTRLGSSVATMPAKQITLSPSNLYGRTQSRLPRLLPSLQASTDTSWLRPTTTHQHTCSGMLC